MKTARMFGRILAPAGLVFLAACQTTPGSKATAQAPAEAPAATTPAEQQAVNRGAPVAVFLADTANQTGWTPVQIQSGTLYVNPQPVLTRDDFTGVKAGTNRDGQGLLALSMSPDAQKKVADITTKNPNKRLALVVGRTMLAAPGYSQPVKADQLVFAVGTEQNATAAAQAIAGVPPASGGTGAGATGAAPAAPTGGSSQLAPAR